MKIMISYQVETAEEAAAIIAAVEAIGKTPHACSKQYVEPRSLISKANEKLLETVDAPEPAKLRVNKSPGAPTTTKIGTKTMQWVLAELSTQDRLPAHFGTKNLENLKLLWSRGKIKFDGTHYYA